MTPSPERVLLEAARLIYPGDDAKAEAALVERLRNAADDETRNLIESTLALMLKERA